MRHEQPRPGLVGSAFQISDEYERQLEAMSPKDFALELDAVIAAIEPRGPGNDRIRIYRRVLCRRLGA